MWILVQLLLAFAFIALVCYLGYKLMAFVLGRLLSLVPSHLRFAEGSGFVIFLSLAFFGTGLLIFPGFPKEKLTSEPMLFVALFFFILSVLLLCLIIYSSWVKKDKLIMTEEEMKPEDLYRVLQSLRGAKIDDYGIVVPNGMALAGTLGTNSYFGLFVPEEGAWSIYRPSYRSEYTDAIAKSVDGESNALLDYQNALLGSLEGKYISDVKYSKGTSYSVMIGETKVEFHYFGAYDKELNHDKEEMELIENEVYQAIIAEKIALVLTLSERPFFKSGDQHERVDYIVTGQDVKKQTFRLKKSLHECKEL